MLATTRPRSAGVTPRIAVLAAAVALVAGCTTVKPVTTASGQEGYMINCRMSKGDCVEKAGELCGAAGYDTQDDVGGFLEPRMVIACR